MAIDSTSYGSVTKVEQLRQRYTSDGTFDGDSNPTLTAVEGFIDDLSDILDTMLAAHGFTTPVTNTSAKNTLGRIVVGYAVDLVDVANSTGRFYNDERTPGNPMAVINDELADWVERHAKGLENQGADRPNKPSAGLLYRDTDESGDETHPMFQREEFGEGYRNWDT